MNRIVIDLMGSDLGPAELLQGALAALEALPGLGLVLVGDEAQIRPALPAWAGARVEILHTTQVIGNRDNPALVFRGREDASVALALDALARREDCVGLLGAGSTGALMVGSIFRLGLLPGLQAPALASPIPAGEGYTCLVDCGANLEPTPQDLGRFARMGSAYARILLDKPRPRVALLNVGREPGKGTQALKAAYDHLSALPIHFVGNAEGSDLAAGFCDVLVCDGWAGNVLLKSYEASGLAAMEAVRRLAAEDPGTASVCARILDRLDPMFSLNTRGGAILLGTVKPVIKMHGCATAHTVLACARQLDRLARMDFPSRLRMALEDAPAAAEVYSTPV